MDLDLLPKASEITGRTLSLEERAGLQIAMRKRVVEEGLESVLLWGRITGEEADYLVCYGYPESMEYPRKQFYACTTKAYELQAFPDMTPEFEASAAAEKGVFKGDPTALLGPGADEEEEEEEEPEEDEDGNPLPPKPKPVRFREFHRLAHVVSQIDTDCAAVPRGAFVLSAEGTVQKNAVFGGLSATEATDLGSYFHFRRATGLEAASSLEKKDLVKDVDFMDSLSGDEPAGCWSTRFDAATGTATLRSLVWPGYTAFHKAKSGQFGGVYFGDGVKNDDIGFML